MLLHGLGHRRQGWDAVVPRLAAERDVIAVDLPAMGESPTPAVGDYRTMADMVEKLVRRTRVERPHVAGNSLGGLIALELAARGSVRSATALSPAGFWNSTGDVLVHGGLPHRRLPGRQAAGPGRRPDRSATASPGSGSSASSSAARPATTRPTSTRDLRGLGREHRPAIDAALARLDQWSGPAPGAGRDVPVTIAWGRRDLTLFPHQARRARRAYPAARFVALPGLGHVPMADDPERVAAVLLEGSRS